jgi:acyl-CoA reductase-like NAD-dependent aldehyde dehydrogenase
MLHLPVLRAGRPYESKDRAPLPDARSGEPVAEVSQANRGLIAKDLAESRRHRRELAEIPIRELLAICKRAAKLFLEAELPLDGISGTTQTPEQFVLQQSSTTGLPHAMCRANMEKTRFVLDEMERVLGGLMRGLDLDVLDTGWVRQEDRDISYLAQADVMGAVLPSNSPGVHSLWLPAIPLKTPLALKPGSSEPWTPIRVTQALIAAGCPASALSLYPTDHGGAAEILLHTQRSMLFGDASTVGGWKDDPRVQLHGPGWSKVLFGADVAPEWERHLDVLAASVADNGGRSCLNASAVYTPSHGREMAEGLARRLAELEAKPLDDPEAKLAGFANPAVAERTAKFIEQKLRTPGAEDLTAAIRGDGPLVEVDGITYVLPTVIWCSDPDHPLAECEFLFPFVAVVEAPQDELLDRIGTTLVATGLTEDARFRTELMASRNIDRLNLGEFPTSRISWDQPHEGNLFEHLYKQRAFQLEPA